MTAESSPPPSLSHAPKPGNARMRLFGLGGLTAVAAIAAYVTFRQAPVPLAQDTAPDVPSVEGDAIVFSESFAKRAGIRLVPAELRLFQPTLHAVGTTDFDPSQVAVVGTRLRGMVGRVMKFVGDTAARGELLATIESPELAEAQAAVQQYIAEKDAAALNSKRETELVARNLSTSREAEIARVELQKFEAVLGAAQQRVRSLTGGSANKPGPLGIQELRSPIAGTVVEALVATGQSVEGNHAAFKIANLDKLWVDVKIFDQSLPLVKLGDKVELRSTNGGSEPITGKVARLGATIDPETRSTSVRVEVDNRARELRVGQGVTAVINTSGGGTADALIVPSSAVTYVDGRPTLFVAMSPTRVQVRHVKLGPASDALVQILEGLKPAEQVVAEGAFALKSELFR